MRRLELRLVWVLCIVVMALAGVDVQAQSAPGRVHGSLSTIGQGENQIAVLHLWGKPYDMGYAHGKLVPEQVRHLVQGTVQVMAFGAGLSMDQIDAMWKQMEPYVPAEYLEEMRGLADGAGVSYTDVCRMHAVPDISEFHCSFFAAWGKATQDGHLIQIRALDYATMAGIQKYPALVVYEPDDGVPFVNVGWCGFVGMVTGMNAEGIAMSEIGDHLGDEHETLEGEPMPFVMRDVIQHTRSLGEAIYRVRRAPRTSSYLYCIGDAEARDARALVTAKDVFRVYDPDSLPYKRLGQTVYMSMGTDSGWNRKIGDVLACGYGRIDPEFAMIDVMRGLGTGDLHAVAFDVTAGKLWVANASMRGEDGFGREFVPFCLRECLQSRAGR